MEISGRTVKSNLKLNSPNQLARKRHIDRLFDGLTGELPDHFEAVVPAQTWNVYWITHSLALLQQPQLLDTVQEDVIEFTKECANEDGGFGGGPGQISHLATTFAAVNALISIKSEEALESIDRAALVRFLHRMKLPDGSFLMHDDGEIDSRATYCALSVLRCLNIQDSLLLENVADWILSCQTYEGGFGSVPGSEAHGGYTFCCVASLCLLNELHRANLSSLLRWLTNKQQSVEGGFCGRSNKLVDSCYSYWQGAVFPLIHPLLKNMHLSSTLKAPFGLSSDSDADNESQKQSTYTGRPNTRSSTRNEQKNSSKDKERDELDKHLNDWLFDCTALQDYVLNQCQSDEGLLKDKPGAKADFYHTCYALSGLSISQHQPDNNLFDIGFQQINLLESIHPLFNLTISSLKYCFEYFANKRIQTYQVEEHENSK